MRNFRFKKILITGATGFVGQNLLLQALKNSYWEKIHLLIRNDAKLEKQLQRFPSLPNRERLVIHKIEEKGEIIPKSLQESLQQNCFEAIIHTAGVTAAQNLEEYERANVGMSLELLGNTPPSTPIIILSSQAAHGPTLSPSKGTCMTQDHPLSHYGYSKKKMEEVALKQFPNHHLLLLRLPMILGARDTATIPLFQMAHSPIRVKPGFRKKIYSWIDVEDLAIILLKLSQEGWNQLVPPTPKTYFLAHSRTITDHQLITTTARLLHKKGITIPLPHFLLRVISAIVERVPQWRRKAPNLRKDRLPEMLAPAWIGDSTPFWDQFFPNTPRLTHTELKDSVRKMVGWFAAEN